MTVNFNDIPEELRSRPQWVLWRWVERPDKTTGELKWTEEHWVSLPPPCPLMGKEFLDGGPAWVGNGS